MRLPARFAKWAKFLAVGLPAFLVAVPLNYVLVETAGIPKPWAYAAVLVMQVTVNFFLCKFLVFDAGATGRWKREFAAFAGGILAFRGLDWLVYVLLVEGVGLYYLLVQVMNVVVFSVAKFLYSERVFAEKPTP